MGYPVAAAHLPCQSFEKLILFGGTEKLLPNVVRCVVKHSVDIKLVLGQTKAKIDESKISLV